MAQQTLRSQIVSQFRKPEGALGVLAGWVMANRPSNRKRNSWTVDLLDLKPGMTVLEIGCGPGIGLQRCAKKIGKGKLVGIDHSAVMIKQARRRISAAIRRGRAELHRAGLDWLECQPERFDRIYSLNVVQFIPEPGEAFEAIHAALAPGGRSFTTYQPRAANPSRDQAEEMAIRIEQAMAVSGFSEIRRHVLELKPVPAICVSGKRP
jgi:cyclopropane fatty-acyl-phospholipid synthase-like methyltransferase